jgi:hypothetical protein
MLAPPRDRVVVGRARDVVLVVSKHEAPRRGGGDVRRVQRRWRDVARVVVVAVVAHRDERWGDARERGGGLRRRWREEGCFFEFFFGASSIFSQESVRFSPTLSFNI